MSVLCEAQHIVRKALRQCDGLLGIPYSTAAEKLLYAIGLQESLLTARRQAGNGPARGLWQFEKGGGVVGVLNHRTTAAKALTLCDVHGVEASPQRLWAALEVNDVLAAGIARLLIYTDPYALPATEGAAWTLYAQRLWRPGKPHPETWPGFYRVAGLMTET